MDEIPSKVVELENTTVEISPNEEMEVDESWQENREAEENGNELQFLQSPPNYLSLVLIEQLIVDVVELAEQHLSANMNPAAVLIEKRGIDIDEEKRIQKFVEEGCGCTHAKGNPCSTLFSQAHYSTMRSCCAEMTWDELNMTIMSQVKAGNVILKLKFTLLF